MRILLTSLVVASAAFTSSAWALQSGDAVTPDALGQAELIQGVVPKTWEPGKVYILEYWATWCGPCVENIPHIDGLYDKYKDKGLRIIGVNIWDEGKDKVAAFVKAKGDGMSYPVVYAGKTGSAFEKIWIRSGPSNGIPYAYVVKDGKYLFGTHPGKINAAMIEGLLAGGEKQDAIVKPFAQQGMQSLQIKKVQVEFEQASRAKDATAMAAKLAELEKLDPKGPYLQTLRERVQRAKAGPGRP